MERRSGTPEFWPAWKSGIDPDLTIPRVRGVSVAGEPSARGVGLPGRVWTSGQPAWIADVTRDSNFPRGSDCSQGEGFMARLVSRSRSEMKCLAVMEFFSREIRQPDDALLQMFAIIGGQVGQFDARNRAQAH